MVREELAVSIEHLAAARIVCVGDIILDRFIYGSVERISPEAPIPVLRVTRETATLGGLGNVARNLTSLGAHCQICSVVGDDSAGRQVQELLDQLPNCRSSLLTERSRQTTIKTRCIAGAQQIVRIDRESLAQLGLEASRRLLESCRQALLEHDVLVLSDYGKGVLTAQLTTKLIQAARAANCPVIVDPKGRDYARYCGATLVTPNRQELHQATGMPVDTDQAIVEAASRLITDFGFEAVLATRSEQGMTLVTREGQVKHLLAEAREVYDVSGAGDTAVATLAAGLAAQLPLAAAAQLANIAAGVVVGKVGTATVRADELSRALRGGRDTSSLPAKVLTRSEAREVVERWRVAGLKVGFTNGCFDLLHPGHVSLLQQAGACCERLIVGLNSDACVRKLKGPQRPLQTESARATVLAALESVALVVIFDEETPAELIEALRPDVLVKGADYTLEQVVGASFVQSYGGEVVLVDLVPQQSTTSLATKLRAAA